METHKKKKADREFDLIVFGASGVTAKYVIKQVIRSAQKESIKWVISGYGPTLGITMRGPSVTRMLRPNCLIGPAG